MDLKVTNFEENCTRPAEDLSLEAVSCAQRVNRPVQEKKVIISRTPEYY
jgi:hypothetical protein